MSMPFRPQPKPSAKGKAKRSTSSTQKKRGEIGDNADAELKERSQCVCELCGAAQATERAHLTGRGHIKHKTTALDLVHLCTPCHKWLDEDPLGIRARNLMVALVEYAIESR